MNLIKKIFPNYKTKKELREELDYFKNIKWDPKLIVHHVPVEELKVVINRDFYEPEAYAVERAKFELSKEVEKYIHVETAQHFNDDYGFKIIASIHIARMDVI